MGAIALQVGGTIRGSEPPKSSCGSWTCKPNSVCSTSHRVGPRSAATTTYRRTAIPLGRALLRGSSDLPGSLEVPYAGCLRRPEPEPRAAHAWACLRAEPTRIRRR